MQADIKVSPVKTINRLNTRKRKLDKKRRRMAGREEGCTKDYVLVLEAEN